MLVPSDRDIFFPSITFYTFWILNHINAHYLIKNYIKKSETNSIASKGSRVGGSWVLVQLSAADRLCKLRIIDYSGCKEPEKRSHPSLCPIGQDTAARSELSSSADVTRSLRQSPCKLPTCPLLLVWRQEEISHGGWEKTFVNHVTDKGLGPRMCKEASKLSKKQKKSTRKDG